jgi:myosin-5
LGYICGTLTAKQTTPNVQLTFLLENQKTHIVTTSLDKLQSDNYKSLPPLRNPSILEGINDLTHLSHLHEPAVLHNVKFRYSQRIIHTYSGLVLLVVNPYRRMDLYSMEHMQKYAGGKRREDNDPHLFAIADEAYSGMMSGVGTTNQSIIVSGESGAGKTQSAKYIMRYFATVDDFDSKMRSRVLAAQKLGKIPEDLENEFGVALHSNHVGMTEVEEAVLASNPITEAFGNAKTTRNDNSSRFGKYTEILFSKPSSTKGVRIVGAKIKTYLLERSRLVFQPNGERNYHIFYQLCVGAPAAEKIKLGLEGWEKYNYLNQGSAGLLAGMDDAAEFEVTRDALSTIGVSVEDQWQMFKICAGLLHLGNVAIKENRSGEAEISERDGALVWACKLLGLDASQLAQWITKKRIAAATETIVTHLSPIQASVARDSVAKYIYVGLFDWIIERINENLGKSVSGATTSIGVLDIYGFEHFAKNSFEQFCINYANEKLQQEFNEHVFKLEQEEYIKEEIDWSFIDFADNQPCIDLIEGKMGIMNLLDEECRLPSGTDQTFVEKLHRHFGAHTFFEKPRFSSTAFTVKHYACDVTYESADFLEKNRDTVSDDLLQVLAASRDGFVNGVVSNETATREVQTSYGQTVAVAKKSSLGMVFKNSLIALMQTIRSTNVHYIRCIKPNSTKTPFGFEPPLVLAQLRACGVLETIRISCSGYPSRWLYQDFVERYWMLAKERLAGQVDSDPMAVTEAMVRAVIRDPIKYQFGKTKVFLRTGMLAYFEKLRTETLSRSALKIQTAYRGYKDRSVYRAKRNGAVKIQSVYRGYKDRKAYQTWRKTKAAIVVSRAWKGYVQRTKFQRLLRGIVRFQALVRGYQTWKRVYGYRVEQSALKIQRAWRSYKTRRTHVQTKRAVVKLQSLWRRRQAMRELSQLRAESKSASKLIETKYMLEQQVFTLSQRLVDRERERDGLIKHISQLEAAVNSWKSGFEKVDAKFKEVLEPAAATKRDLEAIRKDLQHVTLEKTTLESNLTKLKEEKEELTQQTQELTGDAAKWKRQAEEYRKTIEQQRTGYETAVKEAKDAKAALQKHRDHYAKQLDEAGTFGLGNESVLDLKSELDMKNLEIQQLRKMMYANKSAAQDSEEVTRLKSDVARLTKMLTKSKATPED